MSFMKLYLLIFTSILSFLHADIDEQDIAFFSDSIQDDYLVTYQIPNQQFSGINNLIIFFKQIKYGKNDYIDDLFSPPSISKSEEKEIDTGSLQQYFKELPGRLKYTLPICSKEQIKLIKKYTKNTQATSTKDRFFDATEFLKPLFIRRHPFWCIFDAQESQLYVYSSGVLHSSFLNQLTYQLSYDTPISLDLEYTIYSVAEEKAEVNPALLKAELKHHHITAKTHARPGESSAIKIANKELIFDAEATACLSEQAPFKLALSNDFSFKSSLFSFSCNQVHFIKKSKPLILNMGFSKKENRYYFIKITLDYHRLNSLRVCSKHKVELPYSMKPLVGQTRSLTLPLSELTSTNEPFSEVLAAKQVDQDGNYDFTELYKKRFDGLVSAVYFSKENSLKFVAKPSTIHNITIFNKRIGPPLMIESNFNLYKVEQDSDILKPVVNKLTLAKLISKKKPIYSFSHKEGKAITNVVKNSSIDILYNTDFFMGEGLYKEYSAYFFKLEYKDKNLDIQLRYNMSTIGKDGLPFLICTVDGYHYIAALKVNTSKDK